MTPDKRLFLLDAYALIFRGYYAFIKNPRINSKGLNTSAILGFMNTILEVIKKEKPTHMAVVFDVGGSQARETIFEAYKANRDETPDGIKVAVPYIQQILQAMHIPVLFKEGFEADDVIGTLANKAENQGYTTYMMTPDKDFAQLVTDNILIYKPSTKGEPPKVWGMAEVIENMGVQHPTQVIDYLGLMGDAVDNIPGVPGVGPKTALKLLHEFGTIEQVLDNAHTQKGKLRENLENFRDQALLSKTLATIITDVPVEFEESTLTVDPPNMEALKALFDELEFRQLWDNVAKIYAQPTVSPAVQKTASVAVFDLFNQESHGDASVSEPILTGYMVQTLDSEYVLDRWAIHAKTQKYMAVADVYNHDQLVGLAFCYSDQMADYLILDAQHPLSKKAWDVLTELLSSPQMIWVGHQCKPLIKTLIQKGIQIKGLWQDMAIAHYVLSPDSAHDLLRLNHTYTQIPLNASFQKQWPAKTDLTPEQVHHHLGYLSCVLWNLRASLHDALKEANLWDLYQNLEMPLMSVLLRMETEGIAVDPLVLSELSKTLEVDLNRLESEIFKQADESFNINSPKQLGDILFEKLKLLDKPKKTKTGQYATSEDILVKLQDKHPIIGAIMEYRQLQKLKSTYVDALPKEIDPKTGRIHTEFSQITAATGRLSSLNPNLQNIPIRNPRGQAVRKAFVAKDPQHVLVSADYSQIELRLIAELSQDPVMQEAFLKGEDIHAATAAKLFDVDLDKVSREQRGQAKTVNFGIIYGVSAFGLSEQTSLNRTEAKQLIDAYFETYPVLKQYMDDQIELARQQGYVTTIMGRKRYLNDIHSANAVVRSHAERNAINAPIQGSAADLIKQAMIDLDEWLHTAHLKTKLLLQVHDELIFECPLDELDMVKTMIKSKMENAFKTKIPLLVDIGIGANWLEAH